MREQVALCKGHVRLQRLGLEGKVLTSAKWTELLKLMCKAHETNKTHYGDRAASETEKDESSGDDDSDADSDASSDEEEDSDSDDKASSDEEEEEDSDSTWTTLPPPPLCADVSCAEIPLAMYALQVIRGASGGVMMHVARYPYRPQSGSSSSAQVEWHQNGGQESTHPERTNKCVVY